MRGTRSPLRAPTAPWVLPLEDALDECSVGGKAWNLSRMVRLGVPVPRGFVVADASFQSFLDHNQLRPCAATACAGIEHGDPAALRQAADAMQDRVARATIPSEVREAIEAARRSFAEGAWLIVRSSAVGEDTRGSSFAGQLESFPAIRSSGDLEKALVGCWSSCWSERALHYQRTRGIRIEHMGVVIQHQVKSRFAGVLFSRAPDPASGPTEMLVEFCRGHGEDLVSGRINPGRITVLRDHFAYRILEQPDQPGVNGQDPACIEEEQIRSLRRIGLQLEEAFHGPQDIEWAVGEDRDLYVVQARPISVPAPGTRGARGPACASPAPPVVWSNANINENYPDPVTPFLYSVAADGYYHYFLNLARAFGLAKGTVSAMDHLLRNTVGVHGARLYYNLSSIHQVLRNAPFGDHLAGSFDTFVGADRQRDLSDLGSTRDTPPGTRAPAASDVRSVDDPAPILAPVRRAAAWARVAAKASWQFVFLTRKVSAFERVVDAYAEATRPDALPQMTPVELQAALRAFVDIRCKRWTNASLADAASMIGYGLLKQVVHRADRGQEHAILHMRLLQGLPDLVSARPVIEMWRLSRRIHDDPDLLELFTVGDERVIGQRLRSDERFAAFRKEFDGFLEQWGFRCSGELMLTVQSFQEDPDSLLSLLKGYVSLDGESPLDMLEHQAEERKAETARVYGLLQSSRAVGFLPWPNMKLVGRMVLAWTHHALALRERARLKQSLLYSRCRRVVLQIGETLAADGFFRQPDDAFYLTHQELDSLMSGSFMYPDRVSALVDMRRTEQARLGEMDLPDVIILPRGGYRHQEITPEQGNRSDPVDHARVMKGTGACGGRVTARAAVLADVSEAGRLKAGDILVTRQTDPGWGVVFFVVGGLVMERGGLLSHGAIVARECGIPTVVGVRGATQSIHSGQEITVDGDAGYVELLG